MFKRVDTSLTLAQKTVAHSNVHFLLFFFVRTHLSFISAQCSPVAKQHYTEDDSELVKHERTDEWIPKQSLLFGRAFYTFGQRVGEWCAYKIYNEIDTIHWNATKIHNIEISISLIGLLGYHMAETCRKSKYNK